MYSGIVSFAREAVIRRCRNAKWSQSPRNLVIMISSCWLNIQMVVSTLIKKPVIVNGNGENNIIGLQSSVKISKIGYYTRTAMDEMYNHLSVCLAHNINSILVCKLNIFFDQLEMKYLIY